MFTLSHLYLMLIWVGVLVVALVLTLRFHLKYKTVTIAVGSLCAVSEFIKVFCHLQFNEAGLAFLLPSSLPFHYCCYLSFILMYMAIVAATKKNEKVGGVLLNFVAVLGLVGGLLGLIMPVATNYKDLASHNTCLFHSLIVFYALYLIITKQVNLNLKALFANSLIFLGMILASFYINGILQVYDLDNGGFGFVAGPPYENLPILNLDHGWYAYFFTILSIGLLLVVLVHLPYIIKDAIAKRKAKKADQNAQNQTKNT